MDLFKKENGFAILFVLGLFILILIIFFLGEGFFIFQNKKITQLIDQKKMEYALQSSLNYLREIIFEQSLNPQKLPKGQFMNWDGKIYEKFEDVPLQKNFLNPQFKERMALTPANEGSGRFSYKTIILDLKGKEVKAEGWFFVMGSRGVVFTLANIDPKNNRVSHSHSIHGLSKLPMIDARLPDLSIEPNHPHDIINYGGPSNHYHIRKSPWIALDAVGMRPHSHRNLHQIQITAELNIAEMHPAPKPFGAEEGYMRTTGTAAGTVISTLQATEKGHTFWNEKDTWEEMRWARALKYSIINLRRALEKLEKSKCSIKNLDIIPIGIPAPNLKVPLEKETIFIGGNDANVIWEKGQEGTWVISGLAHWVFLGEKFNFRYIGAMATGGSFLIAGLDNKISFYRKKSNYLKSDAEGLLAVEKKGHESVLDSKGFSLYRTYNGLYKDRKKQIGRVFELMRKLECFDRTRNRHEGSIYEFQTIKIERKPS